MLEIELLKKRRRQLRYRANHRGIKEMDIILGKFADRFIGRLEMDELDLFESLMEHNDRDLLQWFTGEQCPPDEFDTNLFQQILSHAKSNIATDHSER